MSSFDRHSAFPVCAALTALLAGSQILLAQAAGSLSSSTPPQQQSPLASKSSAAPHTPPTAEQVADILMVQQRYQEAIQAYQMAPSDSAETWNKMGIAYQLMLNQKDAARCYHKSLKLDPKNPDVWNNLGTVYDSTKDYKSAVKMYHKALKLNPRAALILKNLGTALLAERKYKKGWKVYEAALAIDPGIFGGDSGPRVENPATIEQRGAMNFYMARGCARVGMNERAIEYLRMALDEGFTSPDKIVADREFAGLRTIPAFKQLIAEQKNP